MSDLRSGELSYSAYIWAKGQVEWIPMADWENQLETFEENQHRTEQKWKVRIANRVVENLTFEQIVVELKNQPQLNRISISPQDKNKWLPIYSSYAFMEALNISRRHYLRAPLMGLAKITKEGSRFSYVVRTATIGQGGMGVYGLGHNFDNGTQVQMRIESEDLQSPLHIKAQVVYNTDQGFVGVQFTEISAESTAIIIDYIKKFQDAEDTLAKAS